MTKVFFLTLVIIGQISVGSDSVRSFLPVGGKLPGTQPQWGNLLICVIQLNVCIDA